jgi:hypothetical protein
MGVVEKINISLLSAYLSGKIAVTQINEDIAF